ncbi:Membrane glycoprotein spo14 [Frankliniella fusca]|uniref:Membrane glycoprotein spo14 n=1 Tax=Frankliniella fusca TaxID=407009 RepID=A0AAE1LV83_9NEOP|nr:Membrane glycoprotein spo14 [Frankliniella fusca]
MAGSGGVAPRDITSLERTRPQMTQGYNPIIEGLTVAKLYFFTRKRVAFSERDALRKSIFKYNQRYVFISSCT